MAQYKNKTHLKIFKDIKGLFEEEGDIYSKMKEGILNDYEHGLIPKGLGKNTLLSILKDVAVEFHTDNIEVISEKQYIKTV